MRGDVAEAALWARAIDLVRAHNIESDADAGPLFDDPPAGSDPEVLKRLRQMYEAGGWVLVESAIADLPADLRWLFESGAVTIEQLAAIHRALGVTSAADIADAVREQKLRALPGLDAEVEAAVAAALPTLRSRIPRIPLGRAVAVAEPVLEPLRDGAGRRVGGAGRLAAPRAGHGRRHRNPRRRPINPPPPSTRFSACRSSSHVLHRSERRLYVLTDRVQIGVRLPEPANAGADLLYLTGSRAHFEALQAHAAARGLTLKADGLHGQRRHAHAGGDRRRHLRGARPAVHPARDQERRRRDRAGQPRRAAGAGLARRHPRRSAHALGVERRPRFDRGDGRGRAARSATSTWRSPITRRTRPRRAT